MEIHSAWGTFEWLLYDALDMGYRVGIVCNSDDHKGRPGASYPGASTFGAYGGLTCLLLAGADAGGGDRLSAPPSSLRHHRQPHGAGCAGPVRQSGRAVRRRPGTGTDIVASVREAMMGDILRNAGRDITLVVRVLGSAPIERVELRRGREVLETFRPYATPAAQPAPAGDLGRRRISRARPSDDLGRLGDGARTMRSPRCGRINFWNPDKRIDREGDYLEWEALTTGNFGGFDLVLREPDAGRLEVLTEHANLDWRSPRSAPNR